MTKYMKYLIQKYLIILYNYIQFEHLYHNLQETDEMLESSLNNDMPCEEQMPTQFYT